ncbi:glutamate racemase [Shewanella algae]|uniref:glutamate racemase n=1 Tax=Shewanella algae TaxID=38313 RepID=UPI0005CDB4EB|nr:glutamate racemase [Shewanella algae]MBO2639594.1 glutamate racemase [Shewanella algae]MBO2660661.1 glutamate racemase [Shewanella algae]MBO2698843.1 glutamate racemase [Shewanella algae]MCE9777067.1 glutamate racemase [Shewanella algae]MCL1055436.1 glutamate racemase [Shewanella algae]
MSRPILVFDSGIGGLSVLGEIRKLLPQRQYCYLFDNARLPYGELAEAELISGCVDLVVTMAKQIDAAIVVIACNTASTLVLPELRAQLTIPVVGVVPAIKPAAAISKRKHIGLLATPGTVKRAYTKELINHFACDCQVELFGCSELVLLAEAKAAGLAVDIAAIKKLLQPVIYSELDVLVLGCTHFPMLKPELQQILGDDIELLDSGEAIAKRVKSLLQYQQEPTASQQADSEWAFYTSEKITEGLKSTLAEYGFTQTAKASTSVMT